MKLMLWLKPYHAFPSLHKLQQFLSQLASFWGPLISEGVQSFILSFYLSAYLSNHSVPTCILRKFSNGFIFEATFHILQKPVKHQLLNYGMFKFLCSLTLCNKFLIRKWYAVGIILMCIIVEIDSKYLMGGSGES